MAAAEDGNSDREKFHRADGGAYDPTYTDKTKVFEDWLLANGSRFPKLTMQKYDDEVRGVHAAEKIGPEEIIVEVPLSCLITVEMGKATDVGAAVLAANIELDAPKHVFLMLFMLVDRKREDSHFKPYYDILPETLSNMPIFWNSEELALLEGSYLLTQIEERNIAIETDYAAICGIYPDFANIATLDEFKWARMCVCSRNFGITVDSIRTSAMVPYADMLNHYRPRETKWTFDQGLRAFTITSIQHIAIGAQVYDSYGQKCNHRFLLNYGFSIENNREVDGFCPNEVPFRFALDPADMIYEQKMKFWTMDGMRTKIIRVCVSDNDNFGYALACLRVMLATPEEFSLVTKHKFSVREIRYPISLRNEQAVMTHWKGMIDAMLSAYPRTLDEDKQQLAGDTLKPFSNERHAIIQVAGEKEVLHHLREHCTLAARMMEVDVFDDAEYNTKLRELEQARTSRYILSYLSTDPMGTLGVCRRIERRRIQEEAQQQAKGDDPTKPHIV